VLKLALHSAAMAERLNLGSTRAVALLFAAEAYGRQGPNRPAMEEALRCALDSVRDDELLRAEIEATAWGDCRGPNRRTSSPRLRVHPRVRRRQAPGIAAKHQVRPGEVLHLGPSHRLMFSYEAPSADASVSNRCARASSRLGKPPAARFGLRDYAEKSGGIIVQQLPLLDIAQV
jgi:hypothetical protein